MEPLFISISFISLAFVSTWPTPINDSSGARFDDSDSVIVADDVVLEEYFNEVIKGIYFKNYKKCYNN